MYKRLKYKLIISKIEIRIENTGTTPQNKIALQYYEL